MEERVGFEPTEDLVRPPSAFEADAINLALPSLRFILSKNKLEEGKGFEPLEASFKTPFG